MPYREETWTELHVAPSFPEPEADGVGDVATIGVGEETPIGWLVRQDDALQWLTREDAGAGWRGGVRQAVEEALRDTLEGQGNALDGWLAVLDRAPIAEVELEVPLGELYARIRNAWAAG